MAIEMRRAISICALLVSICTLLGQLFMFTKTEEQIECGVIALIIYAVAFGYGLRGRQPPTTSIAVVLSLVLGMMLGVLPPRLRLSGHFDAFVLFFPVIHIVALFALIMLWRPRLAPSRGGADDER